MYIMFRNILIISLLGGLGCNQLDEKFGKNTESKEVSYSYACLDSTLGGKTINRRLEQAGELLCDLGVSEKSITDSVQTAYGQMFHKQMTEEGGIKLMNDKTVSEQLHSVLNRLLSAREKPSAIRYFIYAIDDTLVNAFTFGGRIYITKGMLEKCKGKEDLLNFIVGHEIGHSEVGHIKATIQELELSNKIFGEETGATVFEIKKLLTASFNQKNELEADYYGINLTNDLGYDVCSAVSFWKEMASKENPYSKVEDFFRTHPFSSLRSECLTNHIRNNFGKSCGTSTDNLLPQVSALSGQTEH